MAIAYRFKGHTVNGRPQEFHAILPARNIQEDELPLFDDEQLALLKESPLYTATDRAPDETATKTAKPTPRKRTANTADKASETPSKASDAEETVDSTLDTDGAPETTPTADKD